MMVPSHASIWYLVVSVMSETTLHTQIQFMLAKLGRATGCDVWVPTLDRDRQLVEERLSDFTLQELPPLAIPSNAANIIKNIDVIWLRKAKSQPLLKSRIRPESTLDFSDCLISL